MLESDPRPRGWEQLSQHGCEASFSVVSYNILSRTLAANNPKFTSNAYVPDPRNWLSRRTLLLTEIEVMDADVVCLQELDKDDYDGYFGAMMGHLGYRGVHAKRHSNFAHGFAVFYRTRRITVVKIHYPVLTRLLKLGQLMAIISAAKVMMRRDPSMSLILTGDMNAQVGSLIKEFVVRGSVDLWSMTEAEFSRRPHGRRRCAVDQQHLEQTKEFKKETWELRDLVNPKPLEYPTRRAQTWTWDQRDLAAPVVTTFAPKVDELRHMARTYRDLENGIVAHPLHMSSVYGVTKIPDFMFHGELMGCRPRLELVARLDIPSMLLQLKDGLPRSDHLAIGAKYRFRDLSN
ncbi:hypothetical protein KVV02_001633 [Mortierella alpina]|uniref:Endonuclease/exonuclease/phosphatase domain-containing protein n=1 Tax=Mortierella alpina TaxID=64518 RepID=A0A9P8D0W8_MORAP|nr:hypothetical protein KVV02_001633 [Mortierella alpina]